jgi:hypothetical protein
MTLINADEHGSEKIGVVSGGRVTRQKLGALDFHQGTGALERTLSIII